MADAVRSKENPCSAWPPQGAPFVRRIGGQPVGNAAAGFDHPNVAVAAVIVGAVEEHVPAIGRNPRFIKIARRRQSAHTCALAIEPCELLYRAFFG